MLLNKNLLRQRYEILALVASLGCNDDLAVTTLNLTHCHLTVDFRNDSWVRRVAGLEQLGNSWKTTGDIACRTCSTRNLDECSTCLYGLTVLANHVTAHWEVVGTDDFAILVEHVAGRHLRLVLRVGDNLLGKTCSLVGLGTIGYALDYVVEAQCTCIFCHDDSIERVPLGNEVALLHEVALLEVE